MHEWAGLLGYEAFLFDAATADGVPVYHTNVVMWLGERIAGVGLGWVQPAQRAALIARRRVISTVRKAYWCAFS